MVDSLGRDRGTISNKESEDIYFVFIRTFNKYLKPMYYIILVGNEQLSMPY